MAEVNTINSICVEQLYKKIRCYSASFAKICNRSTVESE